MTAKLHSVENILARSRELIQLNDHRRAYKLCRKVVSSSPPNLELILLFATSAYYIGKAPEAVKHLRKATRLWPDRAEPLFNLGYVLNFSSRPDEAIAPLSRLVEIDPEHQGAQTNLAIAYFATDQLDLAKDTCLRAIDLVGDLSESAELYNLLGSIYRDLEMNDLSETAFRKAFELNPDYADAYCNLAMMLEESGQKDDALLVSRVGIKKFPKDHRFSLVLAKCERRNGDFDIPVERLSQISFENESDELKASIFYELGRLWDRKDSADKAFECFSKANEITSALIPDGLKKAYFPKTLRVTSKYYAKNDFTAPDFKGGDDFPTPCFLIGFPRSGTTLLELTLAGHPEIAVLEEPLFVQDLYLEITKSNASYPQCLENLDQKRIEGLREDYFKNSAGAVDLKNKKVLVNKHPLDTVYLPVILSVFPDAKIIFSARHPVDVCLSCWMQEFQLNNANINFLKLEDTIDFYSSCMDMWMHFHAHAEMDKLVVSYEDVVDDLEETAKKAIRFLGLGWSQELVDHTSTAKSLPRVNTASYQQVMEPIYARSKFRWLKYRNQLEPILPSLQKYASHFGYEL